MNRDLELFSDDCRADPVYYLSCGHQLAANVVCDSKFAWRSSALRQRQDCVFLIRDNVKVELRNPMAPGKSFSVFYGINFGIYNSLIFSSPVCSGLPERVTSWRKP